MSPIQINWPARKRRGVECPKANSGNHRFTGYPASAKTCAHCGTGQKAFKRRQQETTAKRLKQDTELAKMGMTQEAVTEQVAGELARKGVKFHRGPRPLPQKRK